jgi:hypothetical protein
MPGDLPSRPLIEIARDLREERRIAVPCCRSTRRTDALLRQQDRGGEPDRAAADNQNRNLEQRSTHGGTHSFREWLAVIAMKVVHPGESGQAVGLRHSQA